MILLFSQKEAFSININTPLLLVPAEKKLQNRCLSYGHIGRPNCEKGHRIESADFPAEELARKARKLGLPIASLDIRGGRRVFINTSGEIQYRIEENEAGQIMLHYLGLYDNGLVLAHDSVQEAVCHLMEQCDMSVI